MEEDDEERDMSISQAGTSRVEGGQGDEIEEDEETMDVEGDSMMI